MSVWLTSAHFTPAGRAKRASGLVGWLVLVVDDALQLDGIVVRETRDRRLVLSFPARTDSKGDRHPLIRPVDGAARHELERQVFRQLGMTR